MQFKPCQIIVIESNPKRRERIIFALTANRAFEHIILVLDLRLLAIPTAQRSIKFSNSRLVAGELVELLATIKKIYTPLQYILASTSTRKASKQAGEQTDKQTSRQACGQSKAKQLIWNVWVRTIAQPPSEHQRQNCRHRSSLPLLLSPSIVVGRLRHESLLCVYSIYHGTSARIMLLLCLPISLSHYLDTRWSRRLGTIVRVVQETRWTFSSLDIP